MTGTAPSSDLSKPNLFEGGLCRNLSHRRFRQARRIQKEGSKMKRVLIIIVVLLFAGLALEARAAILCTGTESGGTGPDSMPMT